MHIGAAVLSITRQRQSEREREREVHVPQLPGGDVIELQTARNVAIDTAHFQRGVRTVLGVAN